MGSTLGKSSASLDIRSPGKQQQHRSYHKLTGLRRTGPGDPRLAASAQWEAGGDVVDLAAAGLIESWEPPRPVLTCACCPGGFLHEGGETRPGLRPREGPARWGCRWNRWGGRRCEPVPPWSPQTPTESPIALPRWPHHTRTSCVGGLGAHRRTSLKISYTGHVTQSSLETHHCVTVGLIPQPCSLPLSGPTCRPRPVEQGARSSLPLLSARCVQQRLDTWESWQRLILIFSAVLGAPAVVGGQQQLQ
ncbi:uncharacterized protein LOC133762231 [Lepus europaeus]|uniref:uncharacterized protein LOC133762231 n=1 Tax=Lepus europaeus TaxID=9983 RepID=UPI002B4629FB|nr:uncharacterized protein LOC133762231 [Lepus europaeus]